MHVHDTKIFIPYYRSHLLTQGPLANRWTMSLRFLGHYGFRNTLAATISMLKVWL
jgi:hypothetical protein